MQRHPDAGDGVLPPAPDRRRPARRRARGQGQGHHARGPRGSGRTSAPTKLGSPDRRPTRGLEAIARTAAVASRQTPTTSATRSAMRLRLLRRSPLRPSPGPAVRCRTAAAAPDRRRPAPPRRWRRPRATAGDDGDRGLVPDLHVDQHLREPGHHGRQLGQRTAGRGDRRPSGAGRRAGRRRWSRGRPG